jgi:glycosyltransferase involved in cell wall biosynthesis
MDKPDISIIIPVYNEEDNIPLLYDQITNSMLDLTSHYEIIFVDDGSSDSTFDRLKSISDQDKKLKIIKFRSNFGQSAAMAAGFKHARGKIIISMDGDLQNDPGDIKTMVDQLDQDCDMICGWRRRRKDKLIMRKIPSKIANYLIRTITRVDIHDTGCSLRVYKEDVVKKVSLYGELHRFIPALAMIEGARIKEVEVDHHSRKHGKSKYSIARTLKVLMDMTTLSLFIRYVHNPLRYFGGMGLLFLSTGLIVSFIYLLSFLYDTMTVDEQNVVLALLFLFVASGIQYMIYGMLAEIISDTSKYIIMKR